MIWFEFKGRRSTEFGILEALPFGLRAEKTTSIIEIPGSTPVFYEDGGFKNIKLTLTLGLKDISWENLDAVAAWLNGEGKLKFSNDPNRYYKAVCNGSYVGKRIINRLGKIPITFDILPFRYQDNDGPITLTIETQGDNHVVDMSPVVMDQSAVDYLPVFKLYGSGGELGIYNFATSISLKARDYEQYVVFDAMNGIVYDRYRNVIINETTNNVSRFILKPGGNRILVDAGVEQIDILSYTGRWY